MVDFLRDLMGLMYAPDGDGAAGDGDGAGDGDAGGDGDGDGAGDAGDGDGAGDGGDGKEGDGDGDGKTLVGGDGDKGGDGDAEGGESKDGDGSQDGAPEKYEAFTLPEGMTLNEEMLAQAAPVLKELGLSQEQAQKVIDLRVAEMTAHENAQAEVSKAWQAELKADKDVGGANLKASVQAVRGLIERAGGEHAGELLDMLNDSGMTDFPPLFKFLHRIAGAVGEDAFAGQGRGTPKSDEEGKLRKRYPSMFS